MDKKYYYKISTIAPIVGTTINTEDFIDHARIKRYSKLTNLFELIYNCSKEYNLPIGEILFHIHANFFLRRKCKIEDAELKSCIRLIKKESSKQNFRLKKEFRWFNDFVLEKARNEIFKEYNLILPNRFEACYFFESIEDCFRYYYGLGRRYYGRIIQVELIEIKSLKKLDNSLLTKFQDNYTSDHFFNQASFFLLEGVSENPIFEIVFQGKYKIIAHLPLN